MAVLITLSSLTLLEEPACFALGGIVKGVFRNYLGDDGSYLGRRLGDGDSQ
jgi:hypothetical protein